MKQNLNKKCQCDLLKFQDSVLDTSERVFISNMAYIVWRVLMKKYSRVRLEIRRHPSILVRKTTKWVCLVVNECDLDTLANLESITFQ